MRVHRFVSGLGFIITSATFAAACSGDGLDEQIGRLGSALAACKGTFQLPGGGTIDVGHDWDDMGVRDQWVPSGYTGIDLYNPGDERVLAGEQIAVGAMDGAGCMFGAHGANPALCGGKTGIQSFPNDTSQSVCHAEYHPECAGLPFVLSVCFAGNPGTAAGYVATATAFAEVCGIDPANIIACTGPMYPGNPQQCLGTLVDGNGTPIGDQQVGGLPIVEISTPPRDGVSRCEEDVCYACESAD